MPHGEPPHAAPTPSSILHNRKHSAAASPMRVQNAMGSAGLPWTERCLTPSTRPRPDGSFTWPGQATTASVALPYARRYLSTPKRLGTLPGASYRGHPEVRGPGLPIVVGLPGWVYGPGSWFAQYILEPLNNGTDTACAAEPFTSPVHVDDCARALVHLIKQVRSGTAISLSTTHRAGRALSRTGRRGPRRDRPWT